MDYIVNENNLEIIIEKRDTSLAIRRRLLGYSQAMLAQKSGVPLRTIQQYESRARDINKASVQTLMMLARALECPVEEIIDIYVDEITDCIIEKETGSIYQTRFEMVTRNITKSEAKNDINHGWKFDWHLIQEQKYEIYELFTPHDNKTQGRIACKKGDSYYEVGYVESAPRNIGKGGIYEGVGGNLFAIVCLLSKREGFDGYVSFFSKKDARVMDNYKTKLHAKQVGSSQLMYLDGEAADFLIEKYHMEEENE